jgi:hypothetical protein
MNEQSIIIPIDIQTLVVPVDGKMQKLNLDSRFNDTNVLGIDQQFNLDDLFDSKKKGTFKKGIHLHWRLPKILRHGISNAQDEMEFPTVPNRWMVIRYQTNINDPKAIPAKAWLIKSDDSADNAQKSANWVVMDEIYEGVEDGYLSQNQGYVFKTIGSNEVWNNEYKDEAANEISLSSVGAANPYFSFIYDDSVDVFGFHDSMDDTSFEDTYTYVVTGWYSNLKNDPMHSETTMNEDLVAKIKKLWQTKTSDTIAKRSIFSTTVHSVLWQENTGSGISNAEVGVVLGNNSTEALSRLIVEQNKNRLIDIDGNIEDYLNALQNHLLENDNDLPDSQTLQAENFKRQFVPRNRGLYWELKKIEQEQALQNEQTKPYFPQDIALVKTLKTLNNYQLSYNEIQQLLLSLQQSFYFDWYKKVLVQTSDIIGYDNTNLNKLLDANLAKMKEEIESKRIELKVLQGQISDQMAIIDQMQFVLTPLRDKSNTTYELIKRAEENYYEPNDPAILLYGEGLGNMSGFNQDVRDIVKCRYENEIHKVLNVNNKNWESKDIFAINGVVIKHSDIPSQTIEDLLFEALLLDSKLADFTAINIDGTGKDKGSQVINDIVNNDVEPAQKALLADIEDYAFQKHIQAWQPVFLLWEVDYITEENEQSTTCRGFIPLTNGVSKNLSQLLSKDTPEKYQQVIAQNLSGLHRQLVAQIQVLQLPPLSYKMDSGNFSTEMKLDKDVLSIIDNTNSNAYHLACNPSQSVFSPVRKGYLKINKLSLIDGFGQEKIVINTVVQKDILLPNSKTSKSNENILLDNKIVQPARIAFQWINETKERLYQDTGKLDHPIVGWFVPNFLDNMLMVYDKQGHELKGLRLISDGNKLEEYYPENEGTLSVADIEAERQKMMPEVIQKILDGLDIKSFMKTTQEVKKKLAGSKVRTDLSAVSLLYGNPVAIANAELSIELLGEAYQNQQWSAIDTPNTGGIYEQEIEVTIGNKKTKEDGLVGFYLNDDYTKLYDSETTVKLKVGSDPINITVLMTAGTSFCIDAHPFLPTKLIQLFPHAVEELTQDINISFMLSPFLANKNRQSVPVPMTQNKWMWVHKSAVDVWEPPKAVVAGSQEDTYDIAGSQLYEGWVKMALFNQPKSKV